MSQLADLLTELGIVHDNPDKSAAAVRAVLWRHGFSAGPPRSAGCAPVCTQ